MGSREPGKLYCLRRCVGQFMPGDERRSRAMVASSGRAVVTWGAWPGLTPDLRNQVGRGGCGKVFGAATSRLGGSRGGGSVQWRVFLFWDSSGPTRCQRQQRGQDCSYEGEPGCRACSSRGHLARRPPSSCVPSSLGCTRLHPDLLFHMTYPSNIPGHPGTPDT